MLVALWLESARVRSAVILLACLLTVVGFFVPVPRGEAFWLGLENRGIALFAIVVTAYLGRRLLGQADAVREREGRLRAVLETAPDAILTVDRAGRIESCNPAAGAMFGRRCETLVGTPVAALLPGFPGTGSTAPRTRDMIARRTDGSEFPAEASLSLFPRRDEHDDRSVPVYAAVVRDVTALRDAQLRTLRSERLAAVGETLAVLSHEARNELLALRLGLGMLADAPVGAAPDTELLDGLHASERRLSRLFEDVRLHAGPIRLNPAPCRLPDVWRRAWRACDRSGRVAELVEEEVADDLTGVVDAFRLEQVFRNLFENAVAACPDPVRITVRADADGPPHDRTIQVSVRDNGPGLSPEARRKAFEPFFTTKSEGTGLGLAICSRILEAHGGGLSLADASPGGGAEFVLILPAAGPVRGSRSPELIGA